jgi:hypothetical protein
MFASASAVASFPVKWDGQRGFATRLPRQHGFARRGFELMCEASGDLAGIRSFMVTRNDRLAQFIVDRDAPDGLAVEALCQDHVGTYVLPFPCRRADAAWYNDVTGAALDCDVIGWREWEERGRSRL